MIDKALKKYFGFDSFRTGQREVIERIMSRQSAAAIFPTGAGKSLCYQLPAMLLPHMTLVVSPLLALMKDQIDFLSSRNIPAARLDSTLSNEDYNRILGKARNGELKILMISVERFRNERFRSHLERMKISLMVVDEAHCISEWGHNFRPDYLKLPVYQKEFGIDQVLLLTATATEQVIKDMCLKFRTPEENVTTTGFYRSNLFLQVTPVPESQKQDHLLRRIMKAPEASTIVYVTLQKTAEHVSDFLRSHGIVSSPYHAGMGSEERERIQNEFLAGEIHCVVATIAFGMGIDKKDIRRVIHYDLPKTIENYSQEIGRSGRDGKLSFCEVLNNKDNVYILENFIYGDTPEHEAVDKLLRRIKLNKDPVWETKLNTLSREVNIRFLPLKTLLVYLEMEGVIQPKYTRFDEFLFKYLVDPASIIDKFSGERKNFVQNLFDNSVDKKVWAHVDMQKILQGGKGADRQRVVAALDYFSEKGWIELQSRQTVEAYEILNRDFDTAALSEKMHGLFQEKENQEIQRIHSMVDFFEKDDCISKRLALYFGEDIGKDGCGHCSYCRTGRTSIQHTRELEPLDGFSFHELTDEFREIAGDRYSELNITKFLCGISTPSLMTPSVKKLAHFGVFDRYPFLEVRRWVNANNDKKPGLT